MIDVPGPSAAVVDINLGRDDCSVVCERLSRNGIPFVFYTGQAHTDPIRTQWPMCRIVSKPAPAHRLIAEVTAVVGTGSSSA